MFRVINFTILLRYVAIITTAISMLSYAFAQHLFNSDLPIIKMLSIAPWVVLVVVLIITTNSTSRFIWKILKRFNSSLYPDINGTWEGEIILEDGKTISSRALIRQNLIQVQIDMHTETSKTITLEATPAMEGGQFKLYYNYRSIPKNPNWSIYTGSTIFDVRRENRETSRAMELTGHYFTDRKTSGRIQLRHTRTDIDTDVSYY